MSRSPSPSRSLRADVIVAGGGPAGAVAAALLARAGWNVRLFERARAAGEKICGEYLGPRAVGDLTRLDLMGELGRRPTRPLHGMLMVAPDGTAVAAEFRDPSGAPRHGLAVARADLDTALQEEARHAGAELRFGSTVTGVTVAADAVAVTVRGAQPGEEECGSARLLIGADGRFSAVAHALGLVAPVRGPRRGVIHGWLRGVAGLAERGEMHLFADGSYLGLDPLPDGRLNAGLVVAADEVTELTRSGRGGERLLAAFAASPQLRARAADAEFAGEVRYLAPLTTRVTRVVAPLTLLAGDAAGFLDPLTGEGLALAIASAERAASAAGELLTGRRSPAAALRTYAGAHARLLRGKRLLHAALQWLLRHPQAADVLAHRLARSPAAAERLLAVIGQLRPPSALLWPAGVKAAARHAQ